MKILSLPFNTAHEDREHANIMETSDNAKYKNTNPDDIP